MKSVLITLLLSPLAGALLPMVLGRLLPRRLAEVVSCLAILVSLVMAGVALTLPHPAETITLLPWVRVEPFSADFAVRYDPVASLMALMVTFVSLLITIYSVSYLQHDEGYRRYFGYLNLFAFFMLIIVLADDLLFLFLGWEGVGLCSYALIGFWHEDAANVRAGRKAFVLTRIGDVGLIVAIALLWVSGHSLSIAEINAHAAQLSAGTALVLGLLLLWAATGKSAQLPLLVWLPDAMAGPTPVSALIHAATMVTAGVYLLIRLFPVLALSPVVLASIAVVGTLTALYGALCALAQRDIKRLLAYSTISQVGFMVLAIGAGAPGASLFHLLTHACFKSLLFLAAGCITHALAGEREITRMGERVRQRLPVVTLLFLLGGLALAGVPPASGFFSKGRILLATLEQGGLLYQLLWGVATLSGFLTALYTFRLLFLVGSGRPALPSSPEPQAVPGLMLWVLWPLALLALLAGSGPLFLPVEGDGWLSQAFLRPQGVTLGAATAVTSEWLLMAGETLLAVGGAVVAYLLYGPQDRLGLRGAKAAAGRVSTLAATGFGLDHLYQTLLAHPCQQAAQLLWETMEERVVDRGVLRGVAKVQAVGLALSGLTTGLLSTSLKMLLLGFTAILLFLAFRSDQPHLPDGPAGAPTAPPAAPGSPTAPPMAPHAIDLIGFVCRSGPCPRPVYRGHGPLLHQLKLCQNDHREAILRALPMAPLPPRGSWGGLGWREP